MNDYYLYWSNYYATKKVISDECGEVIVELIKHGWINHDAIIGGVKKQILLFEHKEVSEEKTGEPEKMIICLDQTCIHWGSVISIEDGRSFMVVTKPDWNDVYMKARVDELTDEVLIPPINGASHQRLRCIVANKLFYDDVSWVNQQNVFEDISLKGLLVTYNEDTKGLSVLDEVYVNNVEHYIVKIDNKTLKEYDEEFGILQIVVAETTQGETLVNGEQIKSIVLPERVKDRVLNSISRAMLNDYNKVKRGDYVTFTYDRDKKGTMVAETYLTVNNPTMMSIGYDKSLMYLCESSINLLDSMGQVVDIPVYYENNRVRIDKVTESEYIKLKNSSYLIMIQNNDLTQRLKHEIKRVLINGNAYSITGFDDFTEGIISIGLELDQITPDDDLEKGVANYHSQMDKINGSNPNPPQPSGEIIEANGEEYLYKGWENEYYLQGIDSGVTWSIDMDWISISQDGARCLIKFTDLDYLNETVLLKAKYNENTYEKTIETRV